MKILEGVITSLELNLKKYSSPIKKQRYKELKKSERILLKKLNPAPKTEKKKEVIIRESSRDSEHSVHVHKKQALVNAYG